MDFNASARISNAIIITKTWNVEVGVTTEDISNVNKVIADVYTERVLDESSKNDTVPSSKKDQFVLKKRKKICL